MGRHLQRFYIITGGTMVHVAPHFSLCAPAYGAVGRLIASHLKAQLLKEDAPPQVHLIRTQLARGESSLTYDERDAFEAAGISRLETNDDLAQLVTSLVADDETRCIVMAAAVCDWEPTDITYMANASGNSICDFGKDQPRLRTSPPYPGASKGLCMGLSPAQKIIKRIREQRKDIFLVGFKATAGESPQETYKAGLTLLKQSSCNLVFANDVQNHHNMVVTPEEFPYHDKSRRASVQTLATMIAARTKLDFASTIMVDDAMASPLLLHEKGAIPQNFVPVLKHLIERGAFKPFLGKTSGHFGCKILDSDYIYRRISSVRKVDHNKVFEEGMARIFEARDERRGDQSIRAGGRKPSVGEHTQALIYAKLGDAVHSIVHFHCPMREQTNLGRDTIINIASQKEFECGSVQCGENTALNMRMIAHGVWAVHLDGHGPNIAFHKNVSAVHILGLINQYWDLSDKTGGKII